MSETRFKIGDRVSIDERHLPPECIPTHVFVVGMLLEWPDSNKAYTRVNYTVSDNWPPRNRGDFTDGYFDEDLHPL